MDLKKKLVKQVAEQLPHLSEVDIDRQFRGCQYNKSAYQLNGQQSHVSLCLCFMTQLRYVDLLYVLYRVGMGGGVFW